MLIDRNLLERGLGVPVQIAPGTQPRLVVHYAVSGESRELSLPLTALTGLHLKAKIK